VDGRDDSRVEQVAPELVVLRLVEAPEHVATLDLDRHPRLEVHRVPGVVLRAEHVLAPLAQPRVLKVEQFAALVAPLVDERADSHRPVDAVDAGNDGDLARLREPIAGRLVEGPRGTQKAKAKLGGSGRLPPRKRAGLAGLSLGNGFDCNHAWSYRVGGIARRRPCAAAGLPIGYWSVAICTARSSSISTTPV
jgi:hypothetical protein